MVVLALDHEVGRPGAQRELPQLPRTPHLVELRQDEIDRVGVQRPIGAKSDCPIARSLVVLVVLVVI